MQIQIAVMATHKNFYNIFWPLIVLRNVFISKFKCNFLDDMLITSIVRYKYMHNDYKMCV